MKFEKNINFIDIDKDYLDVIKLDITEDYVTKELFICPSIDSGQYRKFKITIDEFKGTAVPFHLGMYQGRLDDDINTLRFRFYEYANFVKSFLYGATNENLEISNLLSYFSKHLDLPQKSVDILIKILITGKDVIPYKKGKKIYIEASREVAEEGRRRKFLTSIIDELIEKSKRVELLINHGGVIGSYREDLLMNLLQKYLPSKFSVSSGFVEGCIRQIDIIVYDSHNYIPLFKENNIVIVKPESVRAIIEVKSTLRAKDLDESLDLIHSIDKYLQPIIPIFKGVFAFSTTYKYPQNIADRIIKYYNKGRSTGWMPNKLEYLFHNGS